MEVDVRLCGELANDEGEATAHDAVAVTAAQACLHAADALIRHALHQTDVEANLVPGAAGFVGQG